MIEEYYLTLFHELAHSTGHPKRLDRDEVKNIDYFGSARYASEELVDELCSSILCGVAKIENKTIQNNSQYLASWLKSLNQSSQYLWEKLRFADRAAKYIMGRPNNFKSLMTLISW